MTRPNQPSRASLPGFSLIEILVAVGIVTLLVAIAIPVFSLAYDSAKSSRASAALAALDSAEVEYESSTGLRVWALDDSASSYDGDNDAALSKFFQPTDWSSALFDETAPGSTGSGRPDPNDYANAPEHYVERFIALINQQETTRVLWGAVDEDLVVDNDGDGFAEVLDPWGTPIVYAAFVSHNDSVSADDFLPQRGDLTNTTGGTYAPKSPAPFFVSAGPDGEFGSVTGTAAERAAAEDNLYSYDLGKGGN